MIGKNICISDYLRHSVHLVLRKSISQWGSPGYKVATWDVRSAWKGASRISAELKKADYDHLIQ